jgi:hypothetical protein
MTVLVVFPVSLVWLHLVIIGMHRDECRRIAPAVVGAV